MKKLFFLMLSLIFSAQLQSCGGDDAPYEPEIVYHVKFAEIQGTWRYTKNASYHDFTFDGNTYHIEVNNAINIGYGGGSVKTEDGDFTLVNDTITFYPYEGESSFSDSRALIYWSDESHTSLNIGPMMGFRRY